jgi:hypothetical protein
MKGCAYEPPVRIGRNMGNGNRGRTYLLIYKFRITDYTGGRKSMSKYYAKRREEKRREEKRREEKRREEKLHN